MPLFVKDGWEGSKREDKPEDLPCSTLIRKLSGEKARNRCLATLFHLLSKVLRVEVLKV